MRVRVRVRVCVDRTLRKKESSMRSKTLCKAPSMVTTSACWRMGRCLCVCVCIRAYTYIYIHIHTYSIYIYIYIYIYRCVCWATPSCRGARYCMYAYVYICVHSRCMDAHACARAHTHTHTPDRRGQNAHNAGGRRRAQGHHPALYRADFVHRCSRPK